MTPLLKRVILLFIVLLFIVLLFLPIFSAWIYVAQPTFRHNQPVPLDVNPKELEKHVRKLSQDFSPRNYLHQKNLDSTSAYIRKVFEETGAATSVQSFSVFGHNYQNVIARFGTPAPGKGRWIIGAHYDSCSETPGADDNASGIAGLLELARLIATDTNPNSDSLAVELVAYTLEEPPFFRTANMGSAHHAQKLADSGTPVRGVIILEMIGYFDSNPNSQEYPLGLLKLFYPAQGDFLLLVGNLDERAFTREVKIGMKNATPLPIYSINGPVSLPGIDFSDHLNYWSHHFPAVMLTDTAFYRNKNYHGTGDTPERLDYMKMAEGVQAVYQTLLRLDGLER